MRSVSITFSGEAKVLASFLHFDASKMLSVTLVVFRKNYHLILFSSKNKLQKLLMHEGHTSEEPIKMRLFSWPKHMEEFACVCLKSFHAFSLNALSLSFPAKTQFVGTPRRRILAEH